MIRSNQKYKWLEDRKFLRKKMEVNHNEVVFFFLHYLMFIYDFPLHCFDTDI